MTALHTIASYFFQTSLAVRCVLVCLCTASVLSWTAIFYQTHYIYRLKQQNCSFYTLFHASQSDLNNVYQTLLQPNFRIQGIAHLFHTGFTTFQQGLQQQLPKKLMMQDIERTTNIALEQQSNRLEAPLTLLATIAAITPYVGLLGTVFGIIHTLQALSHTQGAMQLSTVAPGIAEALITTAVGLLAAIPATVAYNYCANSANRIIQNYENFQQQLTTQLHLQQHTNMMRSHETVL